MNRGNVKYNSPEYGSAIIVGMLLALIFLVFVVGIPCYLIYQLKIPLFFRLFLMFLYVLFFKMFYDKKIHRRN